MNWQNRAVNLKNVKQTTEFKILFPRWIIFCDGIYLFIQMTISSTVFNLVNFAMLCLIFEQSLISDSFLVF